MNEDHRDSDGRWFLMLVHICYTNEPYAFVVLTMRFKQNFPELIYSVGFVYLFLYV